MEETPSRLRCVNIDWLEVFCLEPPGQPHDAQFYRDLGFEVVERAYGTPVYAEMFTVIDEGHKLIEVRRRPLSVRSKGGVMEDNSCHLRLTNFGCYLRNSISILSEFIIAAGLLYRSLSRIDICLDFQEFDSGLLPSDFVISFMKGDYQKINQCNLAAHGKDGWALRSWNSLKWGSEKSAVTTKLYDKTLELEQQRDKSYIRDIWQACGLVGSAHVWRVEFSVSPHSNFMVSDKEKVLIPRSLDAFSNKERQFFQFCVFANKYFHFKHREYTATGSLRPKNRCADVDLFHFNGRERFYFPEHLVVQEDIGRTEKLLAKRLYSMSRDRSVPGNIRRSCEDIALHMAQRYICLDYVRQLGDIMQFEASRCPTFEADMLKLNDMRRKYQLSDVRPKTVRKMSDYLLFE